VAVEYAEIPTDSVAELAAAFGRYDTVVSCLGFAAGPGTQRKLTEAALAAGVRRYLPWQFGVDYDLVGDTVTYRQLADIVDDALHTRADRIAWTVGGSTPHSPTTPPTR
jgi:hypothetical protein